MSIRVFRDRGLNEVGWMALVAGLTMRFVYRWFFYDCIYGFHGNSSPMGLLQDFYLLRPPKFMWGIDLPL